MKRCGLTSRDSGRPCVLPWGHDYHGHEAADGERFTVGMTRGMIHRERQRAVSRRKRKKR